MIKEDLYININKETELKALLNLNEKSLKAYLYICSKMTFKHKIFGIFKQITAYKLYTELKLKDNKDFKRVLKHLENAKLLYIVNYQENLILSKNKITTEDLKNIIIDNFKDFNIRAERLKELKDFFNWQIDFKKIYTQKKAHKEQEQDDAPIFDGDLKKEVIK